jgi:hypothetical protein
MVRTFSRATRRPGYPTPPGTTATMATVRRPRSFLAPTTATTSTPDMTVFPQPIRCTKATAAMRRMSSSRHPLAALRRPGRYATPGAPLRGRRRRQGIRSRAGGTGRHRCGRLGGRRSGQRSVSAGPAHGRRVDGPGCAADQHRLAPFPRRTGGLGGDGPRRSRQPRHTTRPSVVRPNQRPCLSPGRPKRTELATNSSSGATTGSPARLFRWPVPTSFGARRCCRAPYRYRRPDCPSCR